MSPPSKSTTEPSKPIILLDPSAAEEGEIQYTDDDVRIPPKIFPKFNDLPAEIRIKIWNESWPAGTVEPFNYLPRKKTCNMCLGPYCPRCEAAKHRERMRAPVISRVNVEARECALKASTRLSRWMYEDPLDYFDRKLPDNEHNLDWFSQYSYEMHQQTFWFNPRTDLIYLGRNGKQALRSAECEGPVNHDDVLNAVLDPKAALVLSAFINCDDPQPEQGLFRMNLHLLYGSYLRPRDHVYMCVQDIFICLNEENRQRAYDDGLFNEEEPQRFIDIDDIETIQKYVSLLQHDIHHVGGFRGGWSLETLESLRLNNRWQRHREYAEISATCPQVNNRRMEVLAQERLLHGSRKHVGDAQLLMLQIADCILLDYGLGFRKGEEIMTLDGRLRADHPWVKKYDIKLPTFTPVCLFELLPRPGLVGEPKHTPRKKSPSRRGRLLHKIGRALPTCRQS